MIHYTCDCCKQTIDPQRELHYVVKLEVYASLDAPSSELFEEREHLEEIQDLLDHLEEPAELLPDESVADDIYQQKKFDLCQTCRERFMQNPLGSPNSALFDFSQN